MGFLKRLLGGPGDPTSSVKRYGILVPLAGPVVADGKGRLFAMTSCPTCGVALDPLPVRRRACPACSAEILVGTTSDGIRILHRADNDLGLAREKAEAGEAWSDYGGSRPTRPSRLRDLSYRQMQRAQSLGLVVRVEPLDEQPRTCDPCIELGGQTWQPMAAPLLPFDGCKSRYVCNCRYVLTLPD